MSTAALAPITDPREQALLKAVGLDRVPPEQRELAMHIAQRYDLDLMLKHVVLIEGRPYITRDGLLHVAHRSGVFDGIEVSDPELGETHWKARATVYRKDMTRGFTYSGRYPKTGGNNRFAPEMAVKVAEVMSLRRAFDVSAPVFEERWDLDEAPVQETRKPVQLADKVAARRADIEQRTNEQPPSPPVAAAEVEPTVPTAPSADTPEAEVREAGMDEKSFRQWLRDRFIGLTVAQEYIRATWGDDQTIGSITDAQRAQAAEAVASVAKP